MPPNITENALEENVCNALSLGRNLLIVQFVSATHPNLELKNLTFLGWNNEISNTAEM